MSERRGRMKKKIMNSRRSQTFNANEKKTTSLMKNSHKSILSIVSRSINVGAQTHIHTFLINNEIKLHQSNMVKQKAYYRKIYLLIKSRKFHLPG